MKFLPFIATLMLLWVIPVLAENRGDVGRPSHSSAAAVTLLDRLETRGDQLKSYQAVVTYIREQPLLGDRQIRTGTLTYQSAVTGKSGRGKSSTSRSVAPGSPARFAIRFTHLVVNDALRKHRRNYIFDGTWLAEVDPQNKQFIRRQVVAPGETYDPLQLGRGPFPLPLGQKRQQVLAIFHAVRVDSAGDAQAKTLHLKLTPRVNQKTGKPMSRFTQVNIWYDKHTLLPVKIVTEDDSGNTTTVKLAKAKIDQLTDKQAAKAFDTTPPPPGSGWNVEIKPYVADDATTNHVPTSGTRQ